MTNLAAEIKRRKPLGPCQRCGSTDKYILDQFHKVLPFEAVMVSCKGCKARTKFRPLAKAFTDWRKGRFFNE